MSSNSNRTKSKKLIQPVFIRLWHWSFTVLLTIIIVSGLLITYAPQGNGWINMRSIKHWHAPIGFVVLGLVAARLYYSLITGSYKHEVVWKKDWPEIKESLKYYLFLRKNRPPTTRKYHALQQLIYNSWLLVVLIKCIFGIALLYPSQFMGLAKLVGGFQQIRFIKYLLTLYFIPTIAVHLYLVFTESPARLQAMITGWIREKEDE